MSIDDDLLNAMRRESERQLSGRYNTRTGLVTSYDPNKYSAKVVLKPDPDTFAADKNETGWLPIVTNHAGNGWGTLSGLTPGDGKTTGDQVDLSFVEGDLEQGRIVGRLHSDVDKPPPVQSGEILIKHQAAGSIFFDKNNNLKVTGAKGQADQNQDGTPPTAISKPGAPGSGLDPQSQDAQNGQTLLFDKDGNVTKTGLKGQTTAHDKDGNIIHTGITGATVKLDPQGNVSVNAKNSNDTSQGTLTATATKDITHTAAKNINQTATSGNISRSASSGSISDTASSINHNGNTNVTGDLGVTGALSAASAAMGGFSAGGGGGGFSSSAGGSVTGGFTADKITSTGPVQLPIYTIAGLAAIPSPAKGMIVYLSDTTASGAAAFNAIPSNTGVTTVNRPVTFDGTNWRY